MLLIINIKKEGYYEEKTLFYPVTAHSLALIFGGGFLGNILAKALSWTSFTNVMVVLSYLSESPDKGFGSSGLKW